MPKSITFSLVIAIVGFSIFALTRMGEAEPTTEQEYVSVALAFFNSAAILSIFYILYKAEKESAARFGAIVRNNIATVIVALLINMIGAVVDIFGYF